MRKLSARQKKMLDKIQDENPLFRFADDLYEDQKEQIEAVNVYENMDSDIDRYLQDRAMNIVYKNI